MKLNESIIMSLNEASNLEKEEKNKIFRQALKSSKSRYKDRLNESISDINSLAESIENILKQCNADISYVESHIGDDDIDSVNSKVKEYAYNRIDISCKFKPDSISQYDNDVSLYGTLKFDNNLKLVKADLMTSSGPNILNYDFIKALNALYSYLSSGNDNYDI